MNSLQKRYQQVVELVTTILWWPVKLVMNVLDVGLNALQNLIGVQRMAYFFVLPNLLIFGIFVLTPMLLNFYYGFTDGRQVGTQRDAISLNERDYVGSDNLATLFDCDNYSEPKSCTVESEDFWSGTSNTFTFVTLQVGSMVVLALLTAVVLNSDIVGRGFFRSVFFFPVLLSPVVVALIWKWILRYESGLLNEALVSMGVERTYFLDGPDARNWARFWAIAVTDWAQMGFFTLILLAGLQAIPKSLYEAAQIDGADSWQRFWRITLPLLMPTMTVVLVLALIRAVQAFDQVYVLTGGGPGTATTFIVQYIYETAFAKSPVNFGLAAAASLVLGAVLLMLTLAQLALTRQREAA
ncbi:MAG: sugar ABC transporter permease [Chloroflexi bacterium]|nr:sugar ABC transporter permease [Chloroflexota bacterium]